MMSQYCSASVLVPLRIRLPWVCCCVSVTATAVIYTYCHTLPLHDALPSSALGVDAIEYGGQFARRRGVVAEQAFDAQRHVLEPAGGIEARRNGEADVGRTQGLGAASRNFDQRLQAGTALPRAQASQAGGHQRTVVRIQRHEVGDRSEEHTSELQSLMRISYAVFCL